MQYKDIKEELINYGVQPTTQRLVIYEYLTKSLNHPSCDEIYDELSKVCPTTNLATIYNTLNLFVEKGIVSPIYLNDKCRYEIIKEDHGHFECTECNSLIDFPINYNQIPALEGYIINEKRISFRGICPNCIGQKKEE